MHHLDRLRQHIIDIPIRLKAFSDTELTQHAPDKWSRKQILGHLIDSAINNLKRFTDAQFSEGTYQTTSYNQNQLVIVNQYQTLPLDHLLTLWSSLNTQILYVAEVIPDAKLAQSVQYNGVAAETYTLDWIIEDYVAHLEHHLKTLL
ncbi:hypothetical protein GCM10027592_30060 [Spirosoma flavus]